MQLRCRGRTCPARRVKCITRSRFATGNLRTRYASPLCKRLYKQKEHHMSMKMGWRWYGEGNDPITLSDIKQIPGVEEIVWALHSKMPGEIW